MDEDTIKYILKTLKKLDERIKTLEDDKRPLKLPDLTTKKMEYQMERMMAEGEKFRSEQMLIMDELTRPGPKPSGRYVGNGIMLV